MTLLLSPFSTLLIDRPMKQVLLRPKILDQFARWAMELGEFDFDYRTLAIKIEVLANFLVEYSIPNEEYFETSSQDQIDR